MITGGFWRKKITNANAFPWKQRQAFRCSKADQVQQDPAPRSSHNTKRTFSTTYPPPQKARVPDPALYVPNKYNRKTSTRPLRLDRDRCPATSMRQGSGTAPSCSVPTPRGPTGEIPRGPTSCRCRCWAGGLPWWSARCARSSRGPRSGTRRGRGRSKFGLTVAK